MSVKFINGIGFGELSGAMFFDMRAAMDSASDMLPAKPLTTAIPEELQAVQPWSPWGKNNILPLEMLVDIKSTSLLNTIIEGKSRFAICQGPAPVITKVDAKTGVKTIDKFVDDPEINDFMEDNDIFMNTHGWIRDYVGFHRCVSRMMLNEKGTKISLLRREDVVKHRLAKMDRYGRYNNIFYSAEWKKVRSPNDNRCFQEALLDPANPYFDLRSRIDGGDKTRSFSSINTHPGWDEEYYPIPLWQAALKWIKIAQSIPEMKAAMYENSMRAKFLVIIQESYWKKTYGDDFDRLTDVEKEKKRGEVYDEIDQSLVGAKNAGKMIFSPGHRDHQGKAWADIEIKPIEDSTKQGEYLPDGAASNSEIAFAMLWNNAISGGNQKEGPYTNNEGGSNIREASMLQTIIHEVERHQVKKNLNVVARFNGWRQRLKGLDFIIPATTLTTLDTGASSKTVNTGTNAKSKEE